MGFTGFTLVMPFLPLFIRQLGVTDVGDIALWTGLCLGVTPGVTAVLSPWWGRLADRYGRKIMVERSLVSFVVMMAAMSHVTRAWHVLALRVAQGLFAGYGSISIAMAAESAPPGRMPQAIGLVQTAQRLGPGVGPVIGGMLAGIVGLRRAFLVTAGRSEGAAVAAGGERPSDPSLGRGYYFSPTLLDHVSPDMRVAQEEIFGPVLAIIDFDDVEQAAEIANRSQYGLVAGIWTRDINKALTLASRIKTGQVYINTYGAGGGVELPFGGYKKSGYGREKGLESLASYTQVKNVCVKYA